MIYMFIRNQNISIGTVKFLYGRGKGVSVYKITYAEIFIIRNDTSKVVMPEEFVVEVYGDELRYFDVEIEQLKSN